MMYCNNYIAWSLINEVKLMRFHAPSYSMDVIPSYFKHCYIIWYLVIVSIAAISFSVPEWHNQTDIIQAADVWWHYRI